nr:DUF1475 family protein [Hongsoonwoonella zoysiae]
MERILLTKAIPLSWKALWNGKKSEGRSMLILTRLVLATAALVLSALIAWAFATDAPFWESFGAVAANPWGLVGLADLYLGFLVSAIVIALVEGNRISAAAWIVALFFLGNIASAIWLALRLRRLIRQAAP